MHYKIFISQCTHTITVDVYVYLSSQTIRAKNDLKTINQVAIHAPMRQKVIPYTLLIIAALIGQSAEFAL